MAALLCTVWGCLIGGAAGATAGTLIVPLLGTVYGGLVGAPIGAVVGAIWAPLTVVVGTMTVVIRLVRAAALSVSQAWSSPFGWQRA
jgi:hypothetical protein